MNIVTRVLNRFTEARTVQSVAAKLFPWIGSGVFGPITESGITVTPLSAMQSATVYACVRLISESIAALPIHVYKEVDGVRQRDYTHPVQQLIYGAPNPDMTSFTFRDFMMSQLLLHGRAFARIERDPLTAYPTAIWPLSASDVVVYRKPDGTLVYIYDGIILRPDEVIHLIGFTRDGYTGLGPIQLAAASVGLDLSMTKFGSRFFKSGFLAGVLTREGNLSKEAAEEFKRQWDQSYTGLEHSHGTPLLPPGVKYSPLTMSPEQSQFLESRRFSREELCSLFRVHPSLIGDTTKSSYATLEMTNLGFIQNTLSPWLVRFEQELSRKLFLTSELADHSIRFNIDGLLRADTAARQSYYASGRQWGYLSVNDIRALENLSPIDGGDVYMQPVNMQPVGSTTTPTLPAPATGAAAQVVEDTVKRLLVKESKAVQRAAKKYAGNPDGFKAWVSDWYARHIELVSHSLAPALRAAGVNAPVAEIAKQHCERSKSEIIQAISQDGTINIEDVIDGWESMRPHEDAENWLNPPGSN